MTAERQTDFFVKYHNIFMNRNLPMTETCMCWGLDVGDGWYCLIDNMCRELTELEKDWDVSVIADQLKEKYGTLRFYHHIEYGKRWAVKENPVRRFIERTLWKVIAKINRTVLPKINKDWWIPFPNLKTSTTYFDGKEYMKDMYRNCSRQLKKTKAVDNLDDQLDWIVDRYEALSGEVCDQCGTYGTFENPITPRQGWLVQTICKKCLDEDEKSQQKPIDNPPPL